MNTWSTLIKRVNERDPTSRIVSITLTLNGQPIGESFTTYADGLRVATAIIHAGHEGGEFRECDYIALTGVVERATQSLAKRAA